MPGLDKTGPMGQGSQTGRRQGNCSNENTATEANTPLGRGLGRGFRNKRTQEDTNLPLGRRGGRGMRLGRGFGAGQGRGQNQ